MCGLVGYSGKSNFNKEYIRLALMWNSLERGEDSTGIYSPVNGCLKTMVKGSHFVIDEYSTVKPDTLFIGHVRAATIGGKNVDNAHPFERGDYVLAHNGTLKNHDDLEEFYDIESLNINVDSDIIAACIEKKNDIIDVIQRIKGAAAFMITDKRDPKKLYIFRNSERPLYRAVDKKGNMYISSIEEPLHYNNLFNIKMFKEDCLYTIVDGLITNTKKIKNIPYTKPYTNNSYYNNNNNSSDRDLFKFLNLKATFTATVEDDSGKEPGTFKIKEGDWYYCEGLDTPNNLLRIRVMKEDGNKKEPVYISIPKYMFDIDCVIDKGDIVKMWTDHKSPTNVVTKTKGQYFRVTFIHADGDITVERLLVSGGKQTEFTFSKKYRFIKVLGDDLVRVMSAETVLMLNNTNGEIIDIDVDKVLEEEESSKLENLLTKPDVDNKPKHSCANNQLPIIIGHTDVEVLDEDDDSPDGTIPVYISDIDSLVTDLDNAIQEFKTFEHHYDQYTLGIVKSIEIANDMFKRNLEINS